MKQIFKQPLFYLSLVNILLILSYHLIIILNFYNIYNSKLFFSFLIINSVIIFTIGTINLIKNKNYIYLIATTIIINISVIITFSILSSGIGSEDAILLLIPYCLLYVAISYYAYRLLSNVETKLTKSLYIGLSTMFLSILPIISFFISIKEEFSLIHIIFLVSMIILLLNLLIVIKLKSTKKYVISFLITFFELFISYTFLYIYILAISSR